MSEERTKIAGEDVNRGPKTEMIYFPLRGMQIIGQWPPERISGTWAGYIYNVYTFLMVTFVLLMFNLSENADLVYLVSIHGDMNKITDNLTHCISHILGAYKCLTFLARRDRLRKLKKTLEEDDRLQYAETEELRPKEEVMKANRRNTFALFSLLGVAYSMIAFGATAALLAKAEITIAPWDNTTRLTSRPLPMSTHFPFDTRIVRNYWIAFVFQGTWITHAATMIICLDNVCVGLMAQSKAQFVILNQAILTIEKRSTDSVKEIMLVIANADEDNGVLIERAVVAEMYKQLRKCVKQHQLLIEVCKEINDIYYGQIFSVVIASVIVICVTLFQCATRSPTSMDFIYMFFYLLTICYELSLYCYFGNQVTEESSKLVNSTIGSNWYRCSHSTGDPVRDRIARSYMLTLLIMREKFNNPVVFSVSGLTDINMQSYGSFLNTAYSYFAILRRMSEE